MVDFVKENKKIVEDNRIKEETRKAKKYLKSQETSRKNIVLGRGTNEDYANLDSGSYYNDMDGTYTVYSKPEDSYKTFESPEFNYLIPHQNTEEQVVMKQIEENPFAYLPQEAGGITTDNILDNYINGLNKLPKRTWAGIPTRGKVDAPDLEDRMDYNSNFQLNPYKSVREWRDDSGINYIANVNPYAAAGMGLANQMANPYKQRYFEERDDANKVEEARRAQEALRYERERDKETTRRELARQKYDIEKAAIDQDFNDRLTGNRYEDLKSEAERKEAIEDLGLRLQAETLKKNSADERNKLIADKNRLIRKLKDGADKQLVYKDAATKEEYNKLQEEYYDIIKNASSVEEANNAYEDFKTRKANVISEGAEVLIPDMVLENGDKVKIKPEDFGSWISRTSGEVLARLGNWAFGTDYWDGFLNWSKAKDAENEMWRLRQPGQSVLRLNVNKAPAAFKNRLSSAGLRTDMLYYTVNSRGEPVNVRAVDKSGNLVDMKGTDLRQMSLQEFMQQLDKYVKEDPVSN